ncbi:MAG: 16S rRNA (guanine(966)-N(2))-methyltransferase RsmD [Proteobacteria bacterium]|nr:16S rRNA (guanine(966)-N(2))-methyltransferase RsmD [Pseudomonadota bacterium]
MAKSKQTIRIISGTHRSRRLPVLDFDGLRPTGDRVRETLFNWLQFNIAGKNVLDLCAGTGALGFEAASLGAKQVWLLEKNSLISAQFQRIESDFMFTNTQIITTDAQNYFQDNDNNNNNDDVKFDLIFIDPPFALNLWEELSEKAVSLIKPGGFLYRELASGVELSHLPRNWQLYRQKTFGQVKIELWKNFEMSIK